VRVYLDAAPVIYLVERIQPLGPLVAATLADSNAELVASDLTRLECRVKPIRDGDSILLGDLDDFFSSTVSEIVPLSADVLDRATELSARHRFRAPDAIDLAAALVGHCEIFLTNDRRLNRAVGITVMVVEDIRSGS
jgi:uncharacterized protein